LSAPQINEGIKKYLHSRSTGDLKKRLGNVVPEEEKTGDLKEALDGTKTKEEVTFVSPLE